MPQGSPNNVIGHVGDLGTIRSYGGLTNIYIENKLMKLDPHDENSIFNRTIVIHREPDNIKGDNGNKGSRMACGIIKKGNLFTLTYFKVI